MDSVLNRIGDALRSSILWFFLSIGLFVGGLWLYDYYKIYDYRSEKETKCVLLDKLETVEGSRKHLRSAFYFVLEDTKGRKFDLSVGITDYSQTEIGDTIYFDLKESQIQENSKLDGIVILGVFIFILSVLGLILSVIVFYNKITEE
jgi:hypothetical protein